MKAFTAESPAATAANRAILAVSISFTVHTLTRSAATNDCQNVCIIRFTESGKLCQNDVSLFIFPLIF